MPDQQTSAKAASAGPGSFGAECLATVRLAWPLMLGGLAQMAINTVDVLILGRYSVEALAASALALNLMWAFAIFGIGVVAAVSPLVSAERGRARHSVRDVRRTVRQGMWAAVIIVVPIWLILWHAQSLLDLLGQDRDLSRAAGQFVRVAMWGILPFLLHLILRSYCTALERPAWPLIVTATAVLFNLGCCYALVFGFAGWPGLGLIGAAIANVASNLFLFVALAGVVSMDRRFRRFRLFGRFWRSDWPRLWSVMRLGIPIGVTLALEVTVFNASVFLMGLIGRPSLAAHAVAVQVASLTFQIPLGIAQASTVRVGLAHGRADARGVALAGWASVLFGFAVAACLSLGMALGREDIVAQFVDRDPANRIVFDLAVNFITIAAIFQLFDATQTIGAGVLRGIQDTRWPMIFAALGYWIIGFGVAVLLGFWAGWQGIGVWVGLACGLVAVSGLMLARWTLRGRLGLISYDTR